MEIKQETVDKIWNYLAPRPWQEVEPLMHEISDQVKAAQMPKPEMEKPPAKDLKDQKK